MYIEKVELGGLDPVYNVSIQFRGGRGLKAMILKKSVNFQRWGRGGVGWGVSNQSLFHRRGRDIFWNSENNVRGACLPQSMKAQGVEPKTCQAYIQIH